MRTSCKAFRSCGRPVEPMDTRLFVPWYRRQWGGQSVSMHGRAITRRRTVAAHGEWSAKWSCHRRSPVVTSEWFRRRRRRRRLSNAIPCCSACCSPWVAFCCPATVLLLTCRWQLPAGGRFNAPSITYTPVVNRIVTSSFRIYRFSKFFYCYRRRYHSSKIWPWIKRFASLLSEAGVVSPSAPSLTTESLFILPCLLFYWVFWLQITMHLYVSSVLHLPAYGPVWLWR